MNRKHVTVPPCWGNLAFFACLFVGSAICVKYYKETGSFSPPGCNPALPLHVSAVYLLLYSVHYSFHPCGIVSRFWGIPFRLMRWEKVTGAIYIQYCAGTKGKKDFERNGIFVTTNPYVVFAPEVDTVTSFRLKHPFSTVFITLPKRTTKKYLAVFKRYYPALEFQVGATIQEVDVRIEDY